MNTIKFSNIKRKTTEQHNLETIKLKQVEIFGKQYTLYEPCNLNIFITNKCPNHCSFCINKDYLNTDISNEEFYKSLELLLDELKNLQIEITITGGEPTLNKERFIKTIDMCKQYGFKCRTISTIGINLMKEYNNKHLCEWLVDYGFTHNINISRMAKEDSINNKILGNKNITNDDIERLGLFFKIRKSEMRISCNLINGYIDNFSKMLDFVEFYRNKGVDTIMFRELVGQNSLLLKYIISFNEQFEYIETLKGIYYTVKVYKYKDMIVKYYNSNKNIDKTILSSMSFRNGILQKDFKETIKDLR